MSRTRRAEYSGSKYFDRHCRNHGSCDYCKGNRLYSKSRDERVADEKIKEEE